MNSSSEQRNMVQIYEDFKRLLQLSNRCSIYLLIFASAKSIGSAEVASPHPIYS